ncbi:hypothetical protein PILCRDRAFT_14330 [Piloderma croceum F 1598]|uniref:Uncharacterized protein n=1 Tax=Piloderma croceum (strain F 1598) TaxID=765440 RepID=A0A0C3F3P5_PILCF|nr:hypothetical protein PILCRDRAFT_14330 [Piloderma croceum F 1598]
MATSLLSITQRAPYLNICTSLPNPLWVLSDKLYTQEPSKKIENKWRLEPNVFRPNIHSNPHPPSSMRIFTDQICLPMTHGNWKNYMVRTIAYSLRHRLQISAALDPLVPQSLSQPFHNYVENCKKDLARSTVAQQEEPQQTEREEEHKREKAEREAERKGDEARWEETWEAKREEDRKREKVAREQERKQEQANWKEK